MKQLKVKPTWLKATKALSDAECGRLFRGALKYAFSGEAPVLNGNERIVWEQVMDEVDQQRTKAEHQSQVNKVNVTNRYESLRIVSNRNDSYKRESTPPTTPGKETPVPKKKTLSKERAKEKALSPALDDAVRAFKEMRNRMRKPMTPLAVDLMLKKLEQLAPGNEQRQVAMLMQSIENGWTGVYELKQELKRRDRNTLKNYDETQQAVKEVELDVEEL